MLVSTHIKLSVIVQSWILLQFSFLNILRYWSYFAFFCSSQFVRLCSEKKEKKHSCHRHDRYITCCVHRCFLMHFAVSCCFGQRRPFRSLTVPRRRRRRRRHCTRRLSTIYHSSWCFLIRLLFMFFSPISPPKLIAEHCATFHNFCKLWSILKHYRSLSSDVDNDISNICEKMRIEIARKNRLM